MNAVSAAPAAGPTTALPGRRRIRHRFGAARAIRLADLVDLLALAAGHFLRHTPPFQVGLDLPGREVAVLGVLGQVDLDELKEPALVGGEGAPRPGQLLFEVAGGVEAL